MLKKFDLDASDSENESDEENENIKDTVPETEDTLEIGSEELYDQEPDPYDMIPNFVQNTEPQITVPDLNQETESLEILGVPVYTVMSDLK